MVRSTFEQFFRGLRLNKASQRVLEKVGFLREGVLRKYTFVKGTVKDLVVFSFLSTDEINSSD
jgi:RimJ/RimL family protein N-acetyltransferase